MRLIGRNFRLLLVRPSVVFDNFGQRWPWLPVWFFIAALQGTTSLLLLDRRAFELPPPLLVLMTSSALLNPGLTLLIHVIIMAFIMRIAGLLQGLDVPFGKWYSLIMWCFLPVGVLGLALRTVVRYVWNVPAVFLGPAALLPLESHGLTKVLFASLDIFALWSVILIWLGTRIITRQLVPPLISAGVLYGFFFLSAYQVWS